MLGHDWIHQEIGESWIIVDLPLPTIVNINFTSKLYHSDALKDQII